MRKSAIAVAALFTSGVSVLGVSTAASAHDSPYVTVAWQYPGYPDITQPQPFVASVDGADLNAFDSYIGTAEYCGAAYQIDVYKKTVDGKSWETLKETGSLQYAHDGGFLAYGLGFTPYRVITAQENACQATPTPTPSPTPTISETPQPTPTVTPTSSAGPTSSATPVVPSTEPTPRPTPSASAPTPGTSNGMTPAPTVTTGTTTPSSSPATAQFEALAYTGSNSNNWQWLGWALLGAGALTYTAMMIRKTKEKKS